MNIANILQTAIKINTTIHQGKAEKNMTGFIRGLFNKKQADDIETPAPVVTESEDANSFFLDADSAKTFGDIDYMRTPKSVRKTFPKKGDSKEGAEMEEVISSVEKVSESVSFVKKVEPQVSPSPKASDRRPKTDSSMDMFRNMAKDIKKK
jgi:hypothetical protein